MISISQIHLEHIEKTRDQFRNDNPKALENEKKGFINWYVENHKAPMDVLIHDLSNYYLHISENRILRYLNEPNEER